MRAILVSELGPASVLVPSTLPTPQPAAGEVLIEVTGAGVGPWDVKVRTGGFPGSLPYVPGGELSGIVSAVGDGVTDHAVGDAVYGSTGVTGGYAEYAVVAASHLAAAPAGLDLEAAGAVPVGASTALQGLDEHVRPEAGETLLVTGAAGGVGLFVVQLAKARGARVVATASPSNHEFLRRMGADEVVDYHTDWVDAVRGVDAAFDCVGGATWSGCVAAVRDGGRAVTTAGGSEPVGRDAITASTFNVDVSTERLATVARVIGDGQVRVEIAARVPLDEAARAHELVESGHTRGKIVLIPG
jgi:NADPH:quinone reductase-like Zn-dependent oxidoreductase